MVEQRSRAGYFDRLIEGVQTRTPAEAPARSIGTGMTEVVREIGSMNAPIGHVALPEADTAYTSSESRTAGPFLPEAATRGKADSASLPLPPLPPPAVSTLRGSREASGPLVDDPRLRRPGHPPTPAVLPAAASAGVECSTPGALPARTVTAARTPSAEPARRGVEPRRAVSGSDGSVTPHGRIVQDTQGLPAERAIEVERAVARLLARSAASIIQAADLPAATPPPLSPPEAAEPRARADESMRPAVAQLPAHHPAEPAAAVPAPAPVQIGTIEVTVLPPEQPAPVAPVAVSERAWSRLSRLTTAYGFGQG